MKLKRDKVHSIRDTLFGRLSARGLMPIEISRFIKDVFNIIRDDRTYTVASITEQLERVGWGGRIMDEVCFGLIIFLFENEYQFERGK